MASHRVILPAQSPPDPLRPGSPVVITGEEAHHAARVRRVVVGDSLDLLTGKGLIAAARVAEIRKHARSGEWEIEVTITAVRHVQPARPRLDVRTPAPKGHRLEDMIDQLSQVGAASWGPLRSERTIVEPREGKLSRLDRVAAEAAKQCGRAWTLEISPLSELHALTHDHITVVADASGVPYTPSSDHAERLMLLVGPEGGWSPAELCTFREHRCVIASFGVHVMRIETAAVVAAGILLETLRPKDPTQDVALTPAR